VSKRRDRKRRGASVALSRVKLRPATRDQVNHLVALWHRHHRPVKGLRFAAIAEIDGEPVGAVIVGKPGARALARDPRIAEVTRLAIRERGIPNVGSRLLGAAWRAHKALGGTRMLSYVRIDEAGSVYQAAGWEAVAETEARDWRTERHLLLPGIMDATTEPCARVRWEIRT
jgi:hypothetical protein